MADVIRTDIDRVIVEIEENEYEIAEKTVETADRLIDAQKKCKGQPEYKLWLAELEVLLGRDAVRELFHSGKKENIDRIQRIHVGVCRAFEYNSQKVQEEAMDRQREALAPLSELFRQLAAAMKTDEKKVIRRG